MRVGIWGHFHGGNFGDDLVVRTLIEGLRRRDPAAEIVAFAQAPDSASELHGVPAVPIHANYRPGLDYQRPTFWRRHGGWLPLRALRYLVRLAIALLREPVFMLRGYRRLKKLDLVVVAGSGQLQDTYAGPFGMPFTAFKWALAARLAGTPMMFLGVGVGPRVVTPIGRFFLRNALRLSPHVSVRDRVSADVAESLTGERYPEIPDMAFALDVSRTAVRRAAGERGVVGMNTMAWAEPGLWRDGDLGRYEAYRAKLVEFVEWTVRSDLDVVLFSSVPTTDGRMADEIVAILEDRLTTGELAHVRRPQIERPADFFEVVEACDLVVSERFHSVVLPTLLGTPVVALAYEPKTWHVMGQLDRSDFVLDINDFTVPELIALVERTRRDTAASSRQAARAEELRRRVDAEFDRVFDPAQPLATRKRGRHAVDAGQTHRA
ncbi:MAG: polysaccharide pyruvyl transferase family protein [Dehalococcoidia bacterium]